MVATTPAKKWMQAPWEEIKLGDTVRLVGSQGRVEGVISEDSRLADWDGWVKFVGNVSVFDRVDDWVPLIPVDAAPYPLEGNT